MRAENWFRILSSYRRKSDVAQEHFFYFPITTDDFAPNGNWEATVNVGGAQFSKTIVSLRLNPIVKSNDGL